MENQNRDSAIIYRSFYEAVKDLPLEHQAIIWQAICEYTFNFTEIELSGICKTVFILIKPQLDANLQRFKNGCKAKNKQTTSKSKAKAKQEKSELEANNNNNDNNNEESKLVNNNINSLLDGFTESEKLSIEKWVQYKKERKEVYKQTGLESLISQIRNEKAKGCNIEAAILITMSSNWKGIVFEKGYNSVSTKQSTKDALFHCNSQDWANSTAEDFLKR